MENSFAYLKELIISTVMRWLQESSGGFAKVAAGQAVSLQRQMRTEVLGSPERNGRARRTHQRT